jgi:acetylornithine deacetylase/succinyl-diaminopimelate desuccinylase-like protein
MSPRSAVAALLLASPIAAGAAGAAPTTTATATAAVEARIDADSAAAFAPTPAVEAVRRYRETNAVGILVNFTDLLAIPNVASDSLNIARNAEAIRTWMGIAGGISVRFLRVPDAPPVVFGEVDVPGATRTLGIYLHYDGQPVTEDEWTTPPWQPTLYDGPPESGGKPIPWPKPGATIDPEWRLVARSAGDDKAPVAALCTALAGLRDAKIPLTSNLVFFFEGEEEAGSPHLGEYFKRYGKDIAVDGWLLFDGPVHPSRRPQLVFGVRGVTGFEITVYGAIRGLHSGHYGNWAPNPALALCRLLAGMKDADGRVTIDGFYDSVTPLTPGDRAALATVPDTDGALRHELGMAASEGNRSLAESVLLPSLNIRGFRSGDVGAHAANVVPPTATASVDIRLVRGNDPGHMLDLVEAHIAKEGYHIVREDPDPETRRRFPLLAKVMREEGYPAARTSVDDPFVPPLVEAAERAAGEPVILLPSLGGSLPLYLFLETWKVPVVIVPMANHDDDQHAANENLRLANLWYGIDLMASILTMP